MAEYDCLPMKMKMKMKRKDFKNDFSLSSPARKIRRLDLDLPPIMEEDEIKYVPVNEERAIVLYKPIQHYHQPSSSEHLFVDTDLVSSGLKNRFWRDAAVADDLYDDDDFGVMQQAVVRWNESKFQSFEEPPTPEIIELDGEDVMMEEVAMDVEEASLPQQQQQQQQLMGGLHQWQQQQLHCMIPQLPQTNSTPVSWYR